MPKKRTLDELKQFLKDNSVTNLTTGCCNWTGRSIKHGYGRISYSNKEVLAHRISAMLYLDFDLWSDLCVLHKCDNPRCINPEHLFIGTIADNNKDKMEKGRGLWFSGAENRNSKLSESNVLEIRKRHLDGESYSQIQKDYPQVNFRYLSLVCNRTSWKHVS